MAREATEATQGAWVAKAVVAGRRELESQVRQARQQRPAASAAQLVFDTPAQPVCEAAAQPVADPPTTINLRADGVQLARFEALVEKAHKLGLVPTGGDRLDLMLAALESLVSAADSGRPHTAGPAARIIIQQCPDCERAAVTTSRGEKRVAPAQLAALTCDARVQQADRPEPRDDQARGAGRGAGPRPIPLHHTGMSISALSRSPSCEAAWSGWFEPGREPGHAVQPVPPVRA